MLWSHTLGARSIYWVNISCEEWNDVKYIWNKSYLNCGSRWKWRMFGLGYTTLNWKPVKHFTQKHSLLESGDKVRGRPANHKRLVNSFRRFAYVIKATSQPDLTNSDSVFELESRRSEIITIKHSITREQHNFCFDRFNSVRFKSLSQSKTKDLHELLNRTWLHPPKTIWLV